MSEYEIGKEMAALNMRVTQIENLLNAILEAEKKAAEDKAKGGK